MATFRFALDIVTSMHLSGVPQLVCWQAPLYNYNLVGSIPLTPLSSIYCHIILLCIQSIFSPSTIFSLKCRKTKTLELICNLSRLICNVRFLFHLVSLILRSTLESVRHAFPTLQSFYELQWTTATHSIRVSSPTWRTKTTSMISTISTLTIC